MKNMKIKVVALMLVIIMVLTGCATADNTLTIKSDGSTNTKAVVTIEKEPVIAALMTRGFTKEDAENYVNSQAITIGAKKIKVDGKDAYQYSSTENYSKKDSATFVLNDYENGYITGDTYYDVLDMAIDPNEMEMPGASKGDVAVAEAAMKNAKVTYTVVFSKKIVDTNGKIDSQNPNKAIFTLEMGKKNTVFATTKAGQTIAKVQKYVKNARTVKPSKVKKLKANKVKGKNATVTVKLKKVKDAKKYYVEYATNSKFKNSQTKISKKTTVTLKKLKKNKKYYVRVSAMKKDDRGNYVFSKDSKAKTVKTKK